MARENGVYILATVYTFIHDAHFVLFQFCYLFLLPRQIMTSLPMLIQNSLRIDLTESWHDPLDGRSARLKSPINADLHPCLEWDSDP
jgi:hypothetical protein